MEFIMSKTRTWSKSYAVKEAEQEFLANLLASADDQSNGPIIERYGKNAEQYFNNEGHRLIYCTMLELAEQHKTIDCVAIAQSLYERNLLGTSCTVEQIAAVQDKSGYALSRNTRISCADEAIAMMHDAWVKRQLRYYNDIVRRSDADEA